MYLATLPPYRNEDMKPVMSHLQANWRAGDSVYVFHGADPAFRFYSADYGFRDPDYVLGRCHHGVNLGYRLELDAFRGRPRVWVVLTHAIPYFRERDDILSYLDTIGTRRDYFAEQPRASGLLPAELLLYDLSDPRRLESATATSIPLIGPTSVEEKLACQGDPPVIVPPR